MTIAIQKRTSRSPHHRKRQIASLQSTRLLFTERALWRISHRRPGLWLTLVVFGVALMFLPLHSIVHFAKLVGVPHRLTTAELFILLVKIMFVLSAALWFLPKWQAKKPQRLTSKNRFELENEARKTMAQIIGGLFILGGIYLSFIALDLQTNTQGLQVEGQITDRYTKAINQLGELSQRGGTDAEGRPEINLMIRLGGIYALERIAHDSQKDDWTIMEVFTAYVHENSPNSTASGMAKRSTASVVRADVEAILTVIGRRAMDHYPADRVLNLSSLNLRQCTLEAGNFDKVNMANSDLSLGDLSQVHLRGADLSEANLSGSKLQGSDFRMANLRGTDFKDADFGKLATSNFARSLFSGVDISEALNLTQNQIDRISGDKDTKLPPGLVRPASWVK